MLEDHVLTIQSFEGVTDQRAVSHFMEAGHEVNAVEDYDEEEFVDDMSGKPLITSMVHTKRGGNEAVLQAQGVD